MEKKAEKKEEKEEKKAERLDGFSQEQSDALRENFRPRRFYNNPWIVGIGGFITGFSGATGYNAYNNPAPITPTTPAPEM